MRIKVLPISLIIFILSLSVVSCLDNDEGEYEYPDNATISSFSISNIVTELISEENDTTTFTVTGANYKFSIDQLPVVGLIYNRDSLPINTDVTKVPFTITTTSTYASVSYNLKDQQGEDSLCWVSGKDSLDFTEPVIFKVHAWDGRSTKEYQVKLNVHQTVVDSMIWKQVDNNFPGTSITGKQKAITFRNKIWVYADLDPQIKTTYYDLAADNQWSELYDIIGISSKADYSSVIEFNNRLFILSEDNQLYSSEDGINWTNENQTATVLLAAFENKLSGINNNEFIDWELANNVLTPVSTGNSVPDDFPVSHYSFVRENLVTNPAIERVILLGENPSVSDTMSIVWARLSNEKEWIKYDPRYSYTCPNLENISMVKYDDQLYAFGGKDRSGELNIKAFEQIYYSKDYGRIWTPFERYVTFPEEFIGKNSNFSYIVDDKNYLWIMWSGEKEVWKGRISRLSVD